MADATPVTSIMQSKPNGSSSSSFKTFLSSLVVYYLFERAARQSMYQVFLSVDADKNGYQHNHGSQGGHLRQEETFVDQPNNKRYFNNAVNPANAFANAL